MSEWLRSQRLWRNKATGQTGSDYLALLTNDSFTVDLDFIRFPRSRDHRTMFKEIELVPLDEALNDEEMALMKVVPTRDRPIDEMVKVVKQVLAETWPSDKLHLVSHSSGTDTRILSAALCKVYEERGDEWLGDVLFFCREWETGRFKEIMGHQGWKRDQWVIVDEETHPTEWHAGTLDFDTAWQWHNGLAYSTSTWWAYSVAWLQQQGIVPEDDKVQLWTGLGDERVIYVWLGRLYEEMDRYYYRAEASAMRENQEGRHFFHHMCVIEQAARTNVKKERRLSILRAIDPVLADMIPQKHLLGYRTLSCRLYEQVNRDYDASWFGREKWPDVQRTRQAHLKPFWRAYTVASLCEHLINQGVQVK